MMHPVSNTQLPSTSTHHPLYAAEEDITSIKNPNVVPSSMSAYSHTEWQHIPSSMFCEPMYLGDRSAAVFGSPQPTQQVNPNSKGNQYKNFRNTIVEPENEAQTPRKVKRRMSLPSSINEISQQQQVNERLALKGLHKPEKNFDFKKLSLLQKERKKAEHTLTISVALSIVLYITGLFLFSCLPFRLLKHYEKSEDKQTREYGEFGRRAFWVTLLLNIVAVLVIAVLVIVAIGLGGSNTP